MTRLSNRDKADALRALHHSDEVLLLPNIWDPVGALLLEDLEFPAVATASAAVSGARGVLDGEYLPFAIVLDTLRRISAAVQVPVTADIERGYADTLGELKENIHALLDVGVVGINIEDSTGDGESFLSIDAQCERIRACCDAANDDGVPLVINARIDVFMSAPGNRSRDEITTEAIARGRAYADAGADCVYPIGAGDAPTLEAIVGSVAVPVNAYLSRRSIPIDAMRAVGVRRISLGPGFLRSSLGALRRAAIALRDEGSSDALFVDALDEAETLRLLRGKG